MTLPEEHFSSTQVIAARVKELLRKQDWTTVTLARRCAALGMPGLNRSVLANITSGRRPYVTTDELLTLAYALNVAPVHLMVPTEAYDESTAAHRFLVTPNQALSIPATRKWVRGGYCPPDRDPRIYHTEVPREEWQLPQQPPPNPTRKTDHP